MLGAVPLVLGGALIVLLGALTGFAGVRALAGQEPLSTVTVATDRSLRTTYPDPLGFTVPVPDGWTQFRSPAPDGSVVVRFVSPDGRQELSVRAATSAGAVTDALTPEALGVDPVEAGPVEQLPDGSSQVALTTGSGSAQRSTLMRIIPGRDQLGGVWVLQLTSPAGRAEDAVAGLFDAVASGFRATPG
ncbi:hypothetical protein [Pseudonocardia alni]|uniref:hypothetical protein n=1 Tax=Pseudonocardia alni TaxID=33907 RepID=UPI00280B86C9|nr:hypothetical protein [Pseudonocardia alni]